MNTSPNIIRLTRLIEREWQKPCKNASDAHFRADKISRLEERLRRAKSKV